MGLRSSNRGCVTSWAGCRQCAVLRVRRPGWSTQVWWRTRREPMGVPASRRGLRRGGELSPSFEVEIVSRQPMVHHLRNCREGVPHETSCRSGCAPMIAVAPDRRPGADADLLSCRGVGRVQRPRRGGGPVCGVGTTNPLDSRRFVAAVRYRRQRTTLSASKPNWSVPDNTHVTVVMQVGLNTPWTAQATGHGHSIEWTLDPAGDADVRPAVPRRVFDDADLSRTATSRRGRCRWRVPPRSATRSGAASGI